MMTYLQASWGYILMIGGLFLTLVILMIMDGPAQRRDALRREDDQHRRDAKAATGVTVPVSQAQGSPSKNPGAMTT